MEPLPSQSNPPPARKPPQISLGFLMLVMIVFAVMSAGFLYASRIDIIQDELDSLLGRELTMDEGTQGRLPHLVFLLFTLTSPLILAALLSTGVSVMRMMDRRR